MATKVMGLDADYKKYLNTHKDIDLITYTKARDGQFQKGIHKYIGCLSRYLKILGLDADEIFADTPINNEDLEVIFKDFINSTRYNSVQESDKELYVASCLFIYNLVYLYKDCKDFYLDKEKEDRYIELKSMEENLNKEKEKFKEKELINKITIRENNKEIAELKKRLKELEKENAKLSADNIKLKDNINKLEANNKSQNETIESITKELVSIKETALTNDNNEVSMEDKINYINNYHIGVFGGMTNIKQLSSILNNVTYYDSQNEDISSIKNLDMIFINRSFFSHSFTEKIKSVNEKYDIPMKYISGTNMDLIIDYIYTGLKNKRI